VASSFETPRKSAARQDEVFEMRERVPQDAVLDPHGEERGDAARLEP
jgi:hypothetical protein